MPALGGLLGILARDVERGLVQLLKRALALLVRCALLPHKLRHQLVLLEAHPHQQKLLVAQRQLVEFHEVEHRAVVAHDGLEQRFFLGRADGIGHDFLVQLIEVHQVLVHVDAGQALLHPLHQVRVLALVDGRTKSHWRARVLAVVGNGFENLAVVGVLKLLHLLQPRHFVRQQVGGKLSKLLQLPFHGRKYRSSGQAI